MIYGKDGKPWVWSGSGPKPYYMSGPGVTGSVGIGPSPVEVEDRILGRPLRAADGGLPGGAPNGGVSTTGAAPTGILSGGVGQLVKYGLYAWGAWKLYKWVF